MPALQIDHMPIAMLRTELADQIVPRPEMLPAGTPGLHQWRRERSEPTILEQDSYLFRAHWRVSERVARPQ